MGAALTAVTPRVLEMLDLWAKLKADMSERELQAIAKAMYEQRLAEVCTDQRSTPYNVEHHSAANLAFIDYFERLQKLGSHMSFLPDEERKLTEAGWGAQRIADLRSIINMREERDISPIRRDDIDRHLAAAGFAVDDKLRWMLELALYPAYRDAYAAAERQLRGGGAVPTFMPGSADTSGPLSTPASYAESHLPSVAAPMAVADEWFYRTPIEAADRMIAETPKLLEHRKGGKREKDSVGEQTLRQIRWAAVLLQKSLPPGTPMWRVTKAHIVKLDKWFDQLSVHCGKASGDHDLKQSLEEAAVLFADRVEIGDMSMEQIGFSTGTTNKHFNKLGQIHSFMRKAVSVAEPIDFGEFTAPIDKDEREARLRYTREQGEAIFRLPPWTGCVGSEERLKPGPEIIHDGLFYRLLLVWYTGARREELAKLMLDDVEASHGIDYLLIRPTVTGRIKNRSARRVIVIADELIRLGFLCYVEAIRAAGEQLLFPEFVPGADTKRKLGELGGERAGLADARLLLEPGDQVDGVEVAAAGARANDARGDRGRKMGLARAGTSDQHDVALAWQERPGMERAHHPPQPFQRCCASPEPWAAPPLVDRRALEHERVHVLHDRQLGGAHPIADRGGTAVRGLGAQQVGQALHGGALALYAGGDRLVERAGHAFEAEPAHGVDHLMPLHGRLAGCRSGRSRRPADAAAPGLRA